MTGERDLFRVEIYGQSYNVRGEEERAYIEELARFVDAKMRAIAESTSGSDSLKVAILAALNIVDEYFKVERKLNESTTEWTEKVKDLAASLEDALRDPEKSLFA